MNEIYKRVAELLSRKINDIFETEATLETEFKRSFPELKFSRTDHWQGIVLRIVREAWLEAGPEVKANPTSYDVNAILREVYHQLDYNLFTQVLLNLQSYVGIAYQTKDAEKDIEALKESWPKEAKLNPFDAKAKMVKQAATDEEKQHNLALSTMRTLKIVAGFTPMVSFRVSPKGSTPAFADSQNLSMIGIGGDKYLKTLPHLKPFYLFWEPGTTPQVANPHPNGGFSVEAIPYLFQSKSGGEILNEVLFARKIMYEVYGGVAHSNQTCIMIPRLNSVLVVTDQYGADLKRVYEGTTHKVGLKELYPMLQLQEGSRV